MESTFAISGMHCGRCLGKIKEALSPFAESVDVTISPQRATLRNIRPDATLQRLQSAISATGPYTIATLGGQKPPSRPMQFPSVAPPAYQAPAQSWFATYWPLFVIVAYIAIVSLAGVRSAAEPPGRAWMLNFMAGFFLVFSAFKFLDLKGFADAYASYDLLAMKWRGYGFVYPFLELALGLAYLFRFELLATNIATIALMAFSSLGVVQALAQRQAIQCACLGTVLKLPMSTITLVEDVGMAAMAAAMLAAAPH